MMPCRPMQAGADASMHLCRSGIVFCSRSAHLTTRKFTALPLRPLLQLAAPRRGGLTCQAAKKGGTKGGGKKKKGGQAGPKAKVQPQTRSPPAAPASGGTIAKERSEEDVQVERESDQDPRHQEPPQTTEQPIGGEIDSAASMQQPEQPQSAAQRNGQPEQPEAAAQQNGQPEQPEASAEQDRQPEQRQQEPPPTAADIELPAPLRKQQQQPQQDAQKPNFVEGVFQEIRLIEWPTPASALLNTMLVIAIVAGLSGLLFGVNLGLTKASEVLYGTRSSSSSSRTAAQQAPQPTVPEAAPTADSAAKPAAAASKEALKPVAADPKSSFPDLLY